MSRWSPACRRTRAAIRCWSSARFGKGRTAAWTSDIGPHWLSPSFCEWDGYGKLWKNILAWITANAE